MDSNVERMKLKKQQQKARRKEKKAVKERASDEAVHISEALRRVRMLWPGLASGTLKNFDAEGFGGFGPLSDLTYDDWEQLGRDLANCNKLDTIHFGGINIRVVTNVDQIMSFLFRGWTRSSSITEMGLYNNEFSVAGARSMVPFLQNADSLKSLALDFNNIQSEGFNIVFRALCDSPIELLSFKVCGIKSIEIDSEHIPKNLKSLYLWENSINIDGCRGLAKLLHGGDATLERLYLGNNNIDDDGVEILSEALQNNTSLLELNLEINDGISIQGQIMMLKLVNDISSIEATLQTNSTLTDLDFDEYMGEIQECTDFACRSESNRQKVIETQLHSIRRSKLCRLQGIERSNAAFYGEFDPLHLPEILALVGQAHGLSELHVALKSSIVALRSTGDRVQCLEQELAYHQSRVANLQAEIASIKRAEGNRAEVGSDSDNKRRRI